MKPNVTNIKDDITFVDTLSNIISAYNKKKNHEGLVGTENTIIKFLEKIYSISTKVKPIIGNQEDYISIQRILSDDPSIYLSKEISEISYYFSYIFKL